MAIFCRECGTQNEDDALFCDNCGTALRRTVATPPEASSDQATPATTQAQGARSAASPKRRKGVMLAISGGAVITLFAAGGLAWWLQPPQATESALLAALKTSAPGVDSSERMVCIANGLNYNGQDLVIRALHQPSVAWMETLVDAGLYTFDGDLDSGGFFSQPLKRYKATSELAKWGRNDRLCVGTGLAVAAVTGIGEPVVEKRGGEEQRFVQATGAWVPKDAASWLSKPSVREAIRHELPSSGRGTWNVEDDRLVYQRQMLFTVTDRRWVTVDPSTVLMGPASSGRDHSHPNTSNMEASGPGIWDRLAGLFSFGGHPMVGTWEIDPKSVGIFGQGMPPGMASLSRMVITRNSINFGGTDVPATFKVDGSRVLITPESNQMQQMVFTMRKDGAAVIELGVINVVFVRVD